MEGSTGTKPKPKANLLLLNFVQKSVKGLLFLQLVLRNHWKPLGRGPQSSFGQVAFIEIFSGEGGEGPSPRPFTPERGFGPQLT